MTQRHCGPTWPLSCILIFLLVLSITSPQVWQRVARRRATAESPTRQAVSKATVPAPMATPPEIALGPSVPIGPQLATVEAKITRHVVSPSTDVPPQEEQEEAAQPAGKAVATDQPSPPSEPEPPSNPSVDPPAERQITAPLQQPADTTLAEESTPNTNWRQPNALLASLEQLAEGPQAGPWAAEVRQLLNELGAAVTGGSDSNGPLLRQLQALAEGARALADRVPTEDRARSLRRTAYALSRRLDVWQQVLGDQRPTPPEPQSNGPDRLQACLDKIDRTLADSLEGRAWREYLLLDQLQQWSTSRPASLALPEKVLKRLTQVSMTAGQRQFVTSRPVAALRDELRRLTSKPVPTAELLEHVEQYELSGRVSDARLLADDCLNLRYAPDENCRQVAKSLTTRYRNANLRVAVTAELLNRLMPARDPEVAPVRDRVLGMPVYGQSRTSTKVSVMLLPDQRRIRLALLIDGEVAALTRSDAGPATLHNDSMSWYSALKPMRFDLQGLHFAPAEVDVYNRTRLRNVETDFDGIPLFGSLIRGVAKSQHEQKRPEARREIEGKIARRVRDRIDSEAEAQLARVSGNLQSRVLDPLTALSLDPIILDARTDPQRFMMRLRLAGEDQLGSHTPRPRAPSDSLASFQVHESALNNALQRLQLDGNTFTVPELLRHVYTRLGLAELPETDPENDNVRITFAKKDSIAVRFHEGQIVLSLAIAKLRKSPRQFKNFQVSVHFRPEARGRTVQLTRDGTIRLKGKLRLLEQVAVRGVFTRTFFTKRPIDLTPRRLVDDPKMDGLAITQFVVDDGWIGVALGPQRMAQRPTLLQR